MPIVASFNYAHFLRETLENGIGQSYGRWECIFVDDGSTDNTEAIVRPYVRGDNRIRHIHQCNRGPSAAKNRGIKDRRGAYLQFLDASDLIGRTRGSMGDPDEPWMPKISGRGRAVMEALARANIMAINCPLERQDVINRAGLFQRAAQDDGGLRILDTMRYRGNVVSVSRRGGHVGLVRNHHASTTKGGLRMARGFTQMCQTMALANPDPMTQALLKGNLPAARWNLYELR